MRQVPQITGEVLRAWRESRGWTVPETARRIVKAARRADLHVASLQSVERYMYRWEAGRHIDEHYQHLLVKTLGLTTRDQLAAGPCPADTVPGVRSGPLVPNQRTDEGFAQLTRPTHADLFNVRLASPEAAERLALAVTGHLGAAGTELSGTWTLAKAARVVRRLYQDCRYADLVRGLPEVLATSAASCAQSENESLRRALILTADVYHVTAGLLLKLDDPALASVAADRSMQAAIASEDAVAIGSSARIITHTLMTTGHRTAAITTAATQATRLGHQDTTPDGLAVCGALLLRGATAAAQQEERDTALTMVTEAGQIAAQLGRDGNLRWTAFGPVNTAIHRVNIAVTLGDAGTAIDIAKQVNLEAVNVTERKACLLIDIARAYLQWGGRHDRALTALRDAAASAPEEVTGRPSVRRLVYDLAAHAPASTQRDAREFASRVGITL